MLQPRCSRALLETTNPDPEYSQTIDVTFGVGCPIKIAKNLENSMAAQFFKNVAANESNAHTSIAVLLTFALRFLAFVLN